MTQKKGQVGFRYKDFQVEITPYFLYEVNLYRIFKNRSELLSTRYYKSDLFLKIDEYKVVKQLPNFKIIRFISLLGVPESFIKENHLKQYTLYEKRKNRNTR